MTRITISSRDAERVAKSFADLIGAKGLDRIRRKAVNAVGSKVRKETRARAGITFGTSAAALSVQGKAASPGSTDPAYRLWMAHKIPVSRLKAKHRKVTSRGGRKSLTVDTPSSPAIRFRSIRREGSRFILQRAGPLPERGLGDVFVNPQTAFSKEGYPELFALRREAERDLPDAVARAINDHLAKAKKR